MSSIGFVGLGNMGLPMAANLAAAGHRVRGFDVVEGNLVVAEGRGVARVSKATDAAVDAEAVVLMLPAGEHVRSVADKIVPAMAKGSVLIDSSTIDVDTARWLHDRCDEHGVGCVDAPVSGGVGGAEAGTLTFMAGGPDAAFEAARPILEPMAGRIVHCGGAGAGQAAKICNNMLLAISMIGTSEAFALADSLGLSRQALFDVASTSSGRCWSLDTYCPVPGPVPASPANRDYEPGFATALMLKDLRLAQRAATSAGTATPLGAMAAQLYALFAAQGGEGKDFSAVFEFLTQQGNARGS